MTRTVQINRPQPTYKQGFARSADESEYPALWKDLNCAWSFGLGNTSDAVVRDASMGRGRNGTLRGSTVVQVMDDGRSSMFGQGAVIFGDGDHIDANNNAGVSVPPFTMSGWFKTTTLAHPTQVLFWLGDNQGGVWNAHYIGISGAGKSVAMVSVEDNDFSVSVGTPADVITIGDWFHVVGVWKSTTSRSLYFNGQFIGENTDLSEPSGIDIFVSGCERRATQAFLTGTEFFGSFDDIFLYSRALSTPEIQQLYDLKRGGIFQQKPIVFGKSTEVIVGHPAIRRFGLTNFTRPIIGVEGVNII